MPKNNDSLQKTVDQLLRMAGIDTPSQIPVSFNTTDFSTFSPSEFRNMMTNRGNQLTSTGSSLDSLMSTLSQSATNAEGWNKEIEELKILTPEIDDAADIVVSSIFSPTDMQSNALNVMTANTGLGTQTEEAINKILTDFFNEKDHLAERAERWVRDARYGTGGTGILLLPASNIRNMNALSDIKDRSMYRGVNLDALSVSQEKLEEDLDKSCEAWFDTTSSSSMEELDNELLVAAEEAAVSVLDEINADREVKNRSILKSYDVVPPEKLVSAVKNLFSDNKSIRFYTDVTVFEKSKNMNKNSMNKMTQQVFDRCFGNGANARVYAIDPEFDLSKKDNVVVMEFPSSMIIPICVPNEPSKHLAYIAIVDQWGVPLGKNFIDDYYKNGSRSLNEANSRSVTGRNFASQFNSEVTDRQQFEISSNMFTTAMKILIKTKMQKYGLGNIDIQTHNALGSCLFKYLLKDNKIGMVFIPASFVVYTAFDYHSNGTGKSLLEDISTIIALRNTLTMAGILAASENSIPNRTLEVNVDDKNTNPLQTLEMVRNIYLDKKAIKLQLNPMDIQRGMYNKSVTIVPKNLRGIRDGLSVTTEHRSTGIVSPDEQLRELLTRWLIQKLHVPNSTLNDIGQNEFSRSIAITNLHFNNQLHSLQRVVEMFLSRYVRIYTSFSFELQEELRAIIKNTKRTDDSIKNQTNSITGKFDENINFNDAGTVDKYINLIISNMKIDLPKPRSVVDKAQYAEIDQYISTVEKLVNDIYPDELIGTNDQYRQAFAMIKATIKSDYIRHFIQEIGFHSNYNLPDMKDVDTTGMSDLIETLINKQREINVLNKLVSQKVNGESGTDIGTGTDDSDTGDGGEFGNDSSNFEGEDSSNPEDSFTSDTSEDNPEETSPETPEDTEEIPEAEPKGPMETGGSDVDTTKKESKKSPSELEFPDESSAQPPEF